MSHQTLAFNSSSYPFLIYFKYLSLHTKKNLILLI